MTKWTAANGDRVSVINDDTCEIVARVANHKHRALVAAAPDLRAALKGLIAASGHMSPFGGEASVKGVRLAGKYMEALDAANAALAKAARG